MMYWNPNILMKLLVIGLRLITTYDVLKLDLIYRNSKFGGV